jgi:hypothetical protein
MHLQQFLFFFEGMAVDYYAGIQQQSKGDRIGDDQKASEPCNKKRQIPWMADIPVHPRGDQLRFFARGACGAYGISYRHREQDVQQKGDAHQDNTGPLYRRLIECGKFPQPIPACVMEEANENDQGPAQEGQAEERRPFGLQAVLRPG